MVQEARLEALDSGLAPVTDGWFVVNVRDAAWLKSDAFGARCVFEADTPVLRRRPDLEVHRFADLGFTLAAVAPGQPSGMYHAETNQEDFLVPCVIFMTGARTREKSIVYPASEPARRHGAGVETETSSPSEAYASFPHWQSERPDGWDRLPWA